MLKQVLLSATALCLLSGCACFDKKDSDQQSNWLLSQFERDGNRKAELATMAYSQGDFPKAELLVSESLHENPRNQQALLVGALTAEKTGRLNRARQYYEDLIVINGNDTTILGSDGGNPQKIAEIAKNRLRMLAVKQSEIIIENKDGAKVFNISKNASNEQSQAVIERALEKKSYVKPAKRPEIGALFSAQEQNMISRFLTLKELAETDLITKEEFLTRRQSNIGGLLPLTQKAPATGIDQPVPAPDLIIERINVLKEATESRAITPREFSAEREVIIEALLPPNPRSRMAAKAPSKDILGAAKDLRKLEVLYNLNLITSAEKASEAKAIEKYLGINRAQPQPAAVVAVAPAPAAQVVVTSPATAPIAPAMPVVAAVPVQPQEVLVSAGVEEVLAPQTKTLNTIEKVSTVETMVMPEAISPEALAAQSAEPVYERPQNIVPNVSSPF